MSDLKKTRLYAGQLDETVPPREYTLWNFYSSIFVTRLALSGDCRTLREVVITPWEGPEEKALYWGWWDNEDKEFQFIYYGKFLVEMCFPYGCKVEEEAGKGKLMPVHVEVIREVPADEKDERGDT